ncbi:hypothetical protein QLQ85_08870 [Halomonas sp. M4R5S39]|uniref:hypothetical protein n=1 Tax=Halomonas kalidii TaxID=3043293 RepID=UPI0024A7C7F0|nr:hypothetical protein [Halomonas kalidii]MDI5984902.1 hypothetical protein [Halomonas kalidii]
MNDLVTKYRDNLDTSIVVSSITAALIIGVSIYGMRKMGFRTAAQIVSAGK